MTIFEYKCRDCGTGFLDHASADQSQEFVGAPCPRAMDTVKDKVGGDVYARFTGCKGTLKRVFSFHLTPVMHEHYNPSTGSVVSSMGDYRRQLRQASEEAEIRTGGIKHDFQPIGPDEIAATTTDEGMKSTHDTQVAMGLREPTSKLVL